MHTPEIEHLQRYIDPRYDALPEKLAPNTPIIYWMLREHRADHNRGLRLAQVLAQQAGSPLHVVVSFREDLDKHSILARTRDFFLTGLEEVESELKKKNIPFHFFLGDPTETIPQFAKKVQAQAVITDEFPLPVYREWYSALHAQDAFSFLVVDGHNHVPIWHTSEKREYAARTIRSKIWRLFDEFVQPVHPLEKHTFTTEMPKSVNWSHLHQSVKAISGFPDLEKKAGRKQALKALEAFIEKRLPDYAEKRNAPEDSHTSQLSAYFHFGHLSCAEVTAAVQESSAPQKDKEAFLEEFVIRKELSDNFCYYTDNPLSLSAAPDWAQKTLAEHAEDPREHIYTQDEFLYAKTHDPAWNAAQNQLLQTGYMHGYMRMYWAKKILEWSTTPESALTTAIRINDLLELDGRDPNGYVGILWAIAGVHDRPWQERDIFGKIRYMNFAGLKRKFSIETYIATWTESEKNSS